MSLFPQEPCSLCFILTLWGGVETKFMDLLFPFLLPFYVPLSVCLSPFLVCVFVCVLHSSLLSFIFLLPSLHLSFMNVFFLSRRSKIIKECVLLFSPRPQPHPPNCSLFSPHLVSSSKLFVQDNVACQCY